MTYTISDIHGNLQAFENVLDQIKLTSDDELYVLGDVIDRHPYGIQIIQRIMEMPNVHMLLGNHEYMMMDALDFPYEEDGTERRNSTKSEMLMHWYGNGGHVTHEAWRKLSKNEQEKIKEFLKGLPLNYTIKVKDETFHLVHATSEIIYNLCKEAIDVSKAYFCVWDRDTIALFNEAENFTTIYGHTPTIEVQDVFPLSIAKNGNTIGIDCGCGWPQFDDNGCWFGGRLACLRLEDMNVVYSIPQK